MSGNLCLLWNDFKKDVREDEELWDVKLNRCWSILFCFYHFFKFALCAWVLTYLTRDLASKCFCARESCRYWINTIDSNVSFAWAPMYSYVFTCIHTYINIDTYTCLWKIKHLKSKTKKLTLLDKHHCNALTAMHTHGDSTKFKET